MRAYFCYNAILLATPAVFPFIYRVSVFAVSRTRREYFASCADWRTVEARSPWMIRVTFAIVISESGSIENLSGLLKSAWQKKSPPAPGSTDPQRRYYESEHEKAGIKGSWLLWPHAMIDLVEYNIKMYKGCPNFTARVTHFVSSATFFSASKYGDRNCISGWSFCLQSIFTIKILHVFLVSLTLGTQYVWLP